LILIALNDLKDIRVGPECLSTIAHRIEQYRSAPDQGMAAFEPEPPPANEKLDRGFKLTSYVAEQSALRAIFDEFENDAPNSNASQVQEIFQYCQAFRVIFSTRRAIMHMLG
jgi:hypothetical protein